MADRGSIAFLISLDNPVREGFLGSVSNLLALEYGVLKIRADRGTLQFPLWLRSQFL